MDNSITGAIRTWPSTAKTHQGGSKRGSAPVSLAKQLFKGVVLAAATNPLVNAEECVSSILNGKQPSFSSTTTTQEAGYNSISFENPQSGDTVSCSRRTHTKLGQAETHFKTQQLSNSRLMVTWQLDERVRTEVNSYDAIVKRIGKPTNKIIEGSLKDFNFNFYPNGAVIQVDGGQPVIAKWTTIEKYGTWARPINCELSVESDSNRTATTCVHMYIPFSYNGFYSSTDIKTLKTPPEPKPKPTTKTTTTATSSTTSTATSSATSTATSSATSTATSRATSTATSSAASTAMTAPDGLIALKDLGDDVLKDVEKNFGPSTNNIAGNETGLTDLEVAVLSLGIIAFLVIGTIVVYLCFPKLSSKVHPGDDSEIGHDFTNIETAETEF